jgi:hypothetical protein
VGGERFFLVCRSGGRYWAILTDGPDHYEIDQGERWISAHTLEALVRFIQAYNRRRGTGYRIATDI